MSAWELINTEALECQLDESGRYVMVHYINGAIRVDIMENRADGSDEPVMSYQGFASDVRKYVIRYLGYAPGFSFEHASYIGEQIERCSQQKEAYVQD